MSGFGKDPFNNGIHGAANAQRFCYPGDPYVLNISVAPNGTLSSTASPRINSISGVGNTTQSKVKIAKTAPPIPPRPNETGGHRHNSMHYGYGVPYGMGFGSRNMAYSPYGNFGAYGPRPGYSSGYGGGDPDNMFIRMAEESSRPAFQSIESMVNAVGSISMMLESTYFAVYSSYRAVLGVVDQFSRLRSHFTYILSTLAAIRTLQWFFRRVLYFLGLQRNKPSAEAAWSAASAVVSTKESFSKNPSDHQAMWPIFMFMGLVFGAPWLIFRIFSKMAARKAKEILHSQDADQRKVIACYDFQAGRQGELSLVAGQRLYLAPKHMQPKVAGWCLVCDDNQKTGLAPVSYLRRVQKAVSPEPVKISQQLSASNPQPAILELPIVSDDKDSNETKDAANPSVEVPVTSPSEPTVVDAYQMHTPLPSDGNDDNLK